MIEGIPDTQPTLVQRKGRRGKTAVCCFCAHAHTLDTQKRMMSDGLQDDAMLIVADLDDHVGKHYRAPAQADFDGLRDVASVLKRDRSLRWAYQQSQRRGLTLSIQRSGQSGTGISGGGNCATFARHLGSFGSPEQLTALVARCSPTEYLATMPQH